MQGGLVASKVSVRQSFRLSFRPSVSLSVYETRELSQNGKKSVQIFYTIQKSI